ncbi:MAG: RNA-directed DNA polymerase, partial [Planctomicrobium sp.]|nr:RNA-directed DNA polymerase [Planctomicrobium sp.]
NKKKRKIIRNSQRQCVTGVVVNEKVNVSRQDYDILKAILHNCIKLGPQTQNRDDHPNFSDHLRGRIAHVMQLNPARGTKLLMVYDQIRW